ncbi:hypothetical protein RB601_009440 [Gaeumannomyces tritici]
MKLLLHLLAFVSLYAGLPAQAVSTFAPARPPAIPLAVRSPYLNTWLNGDAKGILPGTWPKFWAGQITGWQGFVRVDNAMYNWMGAAPGPPAVNQLSFTYTSTKSIFTFDVGGKVAMTVTFLSPVYPDDVEKQSLQFSYVRVGVKSSDGASHNVQVYMDVAGEFASGGDHSKIIQWSKGTSGTGGNAVEYAEFALRDQAVFRESNEQANWGTWFLATSGDAGLTSRVGGGDVATRQQFAADGRLDNSVDGNPRSVADNWPVFAFARDLGGVSGEEKEVVFTLGLAQDSVVNFQGQGASPTALTGPWKRNFGSAADSAAGFHRDWSAAVRAADSLDERIRADSAAAGGDDYAAITTLAVRQTFGGLQMAQGPGGQQYVFLKEISSNSDVQTVDVIFPAMPILLYLNPRLLRLLLDPLYENQEAGHYPNSYAIHDLGTFPNALGYPAGNDEPMPLEECGNMIIMTLAYAQRAADDDYLRARLPKLRQWAAFLVDDSLVPANQLSTDDFAGTLANQTNLAIKGIIGLRAMAEIERRASSGAAELAVEQESFGAIASSYLDAWQRLAVNSAANPPHTTLSYNQPDSHGLLYNIYSDRLLNLGFVPQSVYDMQSTFYRSVELEFGVALDTRHTWTKSDWQMFAAAVADNETKTMFVSKLRKWIDATTSDRAMTDLYDASTGGYPGGGPTFVARPVMGGLFALLALPKTTESGPTPGSDTRRPICPSCKEQESGALERANFGRTGLWRLDGRGRGGTRRAGSISSWCGRRLGLLQGGEAFQRAWPELGGAWSIASFPPLFAAIVHWLRAR